MRGSSSCSRRWRRSASSAPRRSTPRGSMRGSATSTTRRAPIGDVVHGRARRTCARCSTLRRTGRPTRGCIPEEGRIGDRSPPARAIADLPPRADRRARRPRTSALITRGQRPRNVVPERCTLDRRRRARTTTARARRGLVQEIARRARVRREHGPNAALETRGRAARTAATASRTTTTPSGSRPQALGASRVRAAVRILSGRRGRRERLQRPRPPVRQPRERDDRHPHAGRADRDRGSRAHGRRHARARGRRARGTLSAARAPLGQRDGVGERLDGLVRLEVDGAPCIAYPRLTGEVEIGDVVLVNGRAGELGLGSGGFDVLYANLTRGLQLPVETGAHVMNASLRTGTGRDALRGGGRRGRAERERAGRPARRVSRAHSQLAPGVCGARRSACRIRAARRGSAAGLSLGHCGPKARRLLTTIAVSPSLDGDLQCFTAAAALIHAVGRGAEVVVCAVGPGSSARRPVGPRRARRHRRRQHRIGPRTLPVVAPRDVLRRRAAAPSWPLAPHTRPSRSASGRSARPGRSASSRPTGSRSSRSTPRVGSCLRAPAAGPHGARAGRRSVVLRSCVRGRSPRAYRSSARLRYRPARRADRCPKEIKPQEYRVALTPAGALELVQRGHEVVVEHGRGGRLGLRRRGVLRRRCAAADVKEIWAAAELLLKVKEPIGRSTRGCARGSRSSPTSTSPPTSRSRGRCSTRASPAVAYETVEPPTAACRCSRR